VADLRRIFIRVPGELTKSGKNETMSADLLTDEQFEHWLKKKVDKINKDKDMVGWTRKERAEVIDCLREHGIPVYEVSVDVLRQLEERLGEPHWITREEAL
jgi:hypothetical protein